MRRHPKQGALRQRRVGTPPAQDRRDPTDTGPSGAHAAQNRRDPTDAKPSGAHRHWTVGTPPAQDRRDATMHGHNVISEQNIEHKGLVRSCRAHAGRFWGALRPGDFEATTTARTPYSVAWTSCPNPIGSPTNSFGEADLFWDPAGTMRVSIDWRPRPTDSVVEW